MKRVLLALALCIPLISQSNSEYHLFSYNRYLIILAHPDDETWMNGTLALLAQKKKEILVLYATSGGEGNDYSGQNLSGVHLAKVREQESITALKQLGVKSAPIFLRHQDKELSNDREGLLNNILAAIKRFSPDVVFTFEAHGITGHKDHKLVHTLTKEALGKVSKPFRITEFAVSNKRASVLEHLASNLNNPYRIKHSYPDNYFLLNVHVNKVQTQRIRAFESYLTQFPEPLQKLWKAFVKKAPYEEFIFLKIKNRRHKKTRPKGGLKIEPKFSLHSHRVSLSENAHASCHY